MKKQLPLWLKGLSALLALGLVLCVWEFFSSQNPYILPLKRALKYEVLRLSPVDWIFLPGSRRWRMNLPPAAIWWARHGWG